VLGGDVPALNGDATRPWADAITMIRASELSVSAGHAYLDSRKGLLSITDSSAFQRSSGKSATDAMC
jgi:hypothetical protein